MHEYSDLGFETIEVDRKRIAAMLLPNDRTIHSRFKLPLKLTEFNILPKIE